MEMRSSSEFATNGRRLLLGHNPDAAKIKKIDSLFQELKILKRPS
jgi:hypothetical protein